MAESGEDTIEVDRETYRCMASIVRGWDLWLLTHRSNDELLLSVCRSTEGFCGSEAGSRMEQPLRPRSLEGSSTPNDADG